MFDVRNWTVWVSKVTNETLILSRMMDFYTPCDVGVNVVVDD